MCGICGLSYSNSRIGDNEILQEMNEAIRHRGPDSDGFYTAEGSVSRYAGSRLLT